VLVFILLLLLACAALIATRRFRTAALLSVLPFMALSSASGPITQWMLDRAQASPAFTTPADRPKTTIVLLGGGIEHHPEGSSPGLAGYSRLLVTAQRYLLCQRKYEICRVIVSGGASRNRKTSEAYVYARELARLGVPRDRIEQEDASANTWENARNSSAMLRHDPSRVVIVTSGLREACFISRISA